MFSLVASFRGSVDGKLCGNVLKLRRVGYIARIFCQPTCRFSCDCRNNNLKRTTRHLYQTWTSLKCRRLPARFVLLSRGLSSNNGSGSESKGVLIKEASKKDLQKNDFSRILSLAKPERYQLAGAVCLLLVSSSVTMAMPFCMGKVIDLIYSSSSDASHMMASLSAVSKYLCGVFLIGGAANFGRVYLIQITGQKIVKRLRQSLFTSIMRQETAFFDRTKTGELINRLSADTILIGKAVTDNVSDGLRAVAQTIAGVSMMAYISPKLTGIILGIVPPVALGAVVYGRYLRNITKRTQDSLADATQVAEERVSNIKTVRAFGQESKETQQYANRVEDVLNLARKEALARAVFFGCTGLSGNLIILSVLYSGGMMMSSAQISVGDLTSFLLYTGFVGISVGGLSSFYSELMKGIGASGRVWQLMDRKPLIPYSGGLTPRQRTWKKELSLETFTSRTLLVPTYLYSVDLI